MSMYNNEDFLDIIAPSRFYFDEKKDINRSIVAKVRRDNLPHHSDTFDVKIDGVCEWIYLSLQGAQRLFSVLNPLGFYNWDDTIYDQYMNFKPFLFKLSEEDFSILDKIFSDYCRQLTFGNTLRTSGHFDVTFWNCYYRKILQNRDDTGAEEDMYESIDLSGHLGHYVKGHSIYHYYMKLVEDTANWPPTHRHAVLYDYICSHRSLLPFPSGTINGVDIF